MPAPSLPSPPSWFLLARAAVRRLPAGRFRAFDLLARRVRGPFLDRADRSVGGWRYRCDLRHEIARELCLTGRYAPMETALVQGMLAPGATFVDVGGNIGYFALAGADWVGAAGTVVTLEPDPRMAAALRENLAMNPVRNVVVRELAASDQAGMAELTGFDEAGGNWGVSRLNGGDGAGGHSFTVRCERLDAILDEAGVGSVDLVKIDVEGAELMVLAGMRDGLASRRYRRILVELHPWTFADFHGSLAAAAAEMGAAGYHGCLVEDSADELRRAYYGRGAPPRLRPLEPAQVTGAWPHVLWTLPDYPPPHL